jgi:hypothetical protein
MLPWGALVGVTEPVRGPTTPPGRGNDAVYSFREKSARSRDKWLSLES